MTEEQSGCRALTFAEIFPRELDEIARRRGLQAKALAAESICPKCREKRNIRCDHCGEVHNNLCEEELEEQEKTAKSNFQRAWEMGLRGLAFSGGGIRSATFNLGILQGLAKRGVLGKFDYLSTVSGGGYIGSWFTGWIYRNRAEGGSGGIDEVQEGLGGTTLESDKGPGIPGEEPPPIHFLRAYSNYLTPRKGIFGADTWSMVAIYLRNMLLNLTILITLLGAALLLPRGLLWGSRWWQERAWPLNGWEWPIGLLVVAVFFIGLNMADLARRANREYSAGIAPSVRETGKPAQKFPRYAEQSFIQIFVLAPTFLAAFLLGILFLKRSSEFERWVSILAQSIMSLFPSGAADPAEWVQWAIFGGYTYFVLWVTGYVLGAAMDWILYEEYRPLQTRLRGMASMENSWEAVRSISYEMPLGFASRSGKAVLETAREFGRSPIQRSKRVARDIYAGSVDLTRAGGMFLKARINWSLLILFAWLAGGVGGLLLLYVTKLFQKLKAWIGTDIDSVEWLVASFGTWLLILVFQVTVTFHIGLMGRGFWTDVREWWGRLGGWLFIYSLVWVGFFAVALFAPFLFGWVGGWIAAAAGTGWIGLTGWGVRAIKRTSGEQSETARSSKLFERIVPYVFVAGLLLALSLGVHGLLLGNGLAWWRPVSLFDYLSSLEGTLNSRLWIWFVSLVAIGGLLSWRVDINEFSMHHFYRNRLMRCYLGASSDPARRSPNPFTGFDPADDDALDELVAEGLPDPRQSGPYPILNTTLNLTAGRELAWQQRKAASFVLAPMYCGFVPSRHMLEENAGGEGGVPSLRPGFRPTRRYGAEEEALSLGTAMAVSGAAASPNMGYFTSPALAFLMTVFNVRLGWWMGNPLREAWKRQGPRAGLVYLFFELFGMTNARRNHVYLSDGGHFENLGIYELVRRRCKCILVCDAEQDAERKFGGLGNAIEKCRTDFGVEIDIDIGAMRRNEADGGNGQISERHWALGTVHYDDKNIGALLYVKASLTGDEPVDVLRYAWQQKGFPHQTTADQWFDEAQFESYRKLGMHIIDSFREEMLKLRAELKAIKKEVGTGRTGEGEAQSKQRREREMALDRRGLNEKRYEGIEGFLDEFCG